MGSPVRQFLFVEDLADFVVYCLDNKDATKGIFNVGNEKGISISGLAQLIQKAVNYTGNVLWDSSMPNGAPYKVLDTQKCEKIGCGYLTSLLMV